MSGSFARMSAPAKVVALNPGGPALPAPCAGPVPLHPVHGERAALAARRPEAGMAVAREAMRRTAPTALPAKAVLPAKSARDIVRRTAVIPHATRAAAVGQQRPAAEEISRSD